MIQKHRNETHQSEIGTEKEKNAVRKMKHEIVPSKITLFSLQNPLPDVKYCECRHKTQPIKFCQHIKILQEKSLISTSD